MQSVMEWKYITPLKDHPAFLQHSNAQHPLPMFLSPVHIGVQIVVVIFIVVVLVGVIARVLAAIRAKLM